MTSVTRVQSNGPRGKGIIGRLWENPSLDGKLYDRSRTFEAWADRGAEAYARASDDVSLGLSWEEFHQLGDKYELVRAFRICDGDDLRGILSIDVPATFAFEFSGKKVRDVVRATMPVLKRLVG